jgi:hypothetical protein
VRAGKSEKASAMGLLDAGLHLGNLLVPALGLGALAAALAKLLWWRELRGVSWRRLALPACTVAAAVTLAGLLVFGRDGKMATYGAMVAGCALVLWWRGFGPGRR